MLVLVSRDMSLVAELQQEARRAGVHLYHAPRQDTLERCAQGEPLRTVLIDLNVGDDALGFLAELRAGPCNPQIIAFLDHFVGDLPIRAKLAGADRVIPRDQLRREFPRILSR
jgi:DNA-binding response OmpR family regulator